MPWTTITRASARFSMPDTSCEISTSTSGPTATELSSTISSVRRSRSASTSSLQYTVQARPIMTLLLAVLAVPAVPAGVPRR